MGLTVKIKASRDKGRTSVIAQGSVVQIVSVQDRKAFKLTDSALKSAIAKYNGATPNDVYVRSPTPWGDLYKTYNWDEVRKIVQPIGAKVIAVNTQPVIVDTKTFINDSSVDATYNAGINHSVKNTISSSWTKQNQVSIGQMVEYKVNFLVAGGGGESSFSYARSWGEQHATSQEVNLGSGSGVQVVLKPGQSVTTTLSATRGSMEVEVMYAVKLDGKVAVNYPDKHKDHHFWGLDVQRVMTAGGLPHSLQFKEILKIGFYSEGKVAVSDNKSSKMLAAKSAQFR